MEANEGPAQTGKPGCGSDCRRGGPVPPAGRAAAKTARPKQSYNADEDGEGDIEADDWEGITSSPPKPSHNASRSAPSRARAFDADDKETSSRPTITRKVSGAASALPTVDDDEADLPTPPNAPKASDSVSARSACGVDGEGTDARPPTSGAAAAHPASHAPSAQLSSPNDEENPRPAAVSRKASSSARASSTEASDTDEEDADSRSPANFRKVLGSASARPASRAPSAQLFTIKDEGAERPVANPHKATNAKPPPPDVGAIFMMTALAPRQRLLRKPSASIALTAQALRRAIPCVKQAAGRGRSTWVKKEIPPTFYERWLCLLVWVKIERATSAAIAEPFAPARRRPTKLDKAHTPLKFPVGAEVFYRRPRKRSWLMPVKPALLNGRLSCRQGYPVIHATDNAAVPFLWRALAV
ncbi:hypothetical protein BOTBODRAFT_49258 [Botryobasidium botryosum FD-172 SS1]|uniref:Uncharacterized protein n=1 Tax=Botryobasidium botryosum (strain FD-172 SS1) TaxID=930990 RepID=A0A067M456_BOTB1|nr:hypothetical protein BOTBODRAFT_49258 [Botryobasidium botryosum FD-172 SS1]